MITERLNRFATEKELEAIDQLVAQADAGGDDVRVADLQRDRSALLLLLERIDDAHEAVLIAVERYLEAGDDTSATFGLYAMGLIEASSLYEGGDPRARFETAEMGFADAGDLEMRARAVIHLARLDLAEGRVDDAIDRLYAGVEYLSDADATEHLLEAVRLLAFVLLIGNRADDAYTWTQRGLALARQVGDPTAVLSWRLDLQSVARNPLLTSPADPEPLREVLADIQQSGMVEFEGYAHLQFAHQAVDDRQWADALEHAERARQTALQGPDPVAYLLACLQLAEIREASDDDVGALMILFTCGASLADLLGEDAKAPVLDVIGALEQRWGPERFEVALEAYRAGVADDPDAY